MNTFIVRHAKKIKTTLLVLLALKIAYYVAILIWGGHMKILLYPTSLVVAIYLFCIFLIWYQKKAGYILILCILSSELYWHFQMIILGMVNLKVFLFILTELVSAICALALLYYFPKESSAQFQKKVARDIIWPFIIGTVTISILTKIRLFDLLDRTNYNREGFLLTWLLFCITIIGISITGNALAKLRIKTFIFLLPILSLAIYSTSFIILLNLFNPFTGEMGGLGIQIYLVYGNIISLILGLLYAIKIYIENRGKPGELTASTTMS